MRIRGRAAACAEIEAGGQDLRATGALRTADLDKRQEGGGRGDEKEGRRDLFGRRRRAGGVPAVSSESVCMASPSARRDSAVFQPLSSSWFAAETGDSWAARSHATHAPPRSVLIQRQQQLQPISPLQAHTPAASGPQRPLKLQSIAVFTVHGIVCIFSRSELRWLFACLGKLRAGSRFGRPEEPSEWIERARDGKASQTTSMQYNALCASASIVRCGS